MNSLILNYLGGYLSKKILDISFIGIKNTINRINRDKEIIKFHRPDIDNCIEIIGDNIEVNKKWASNISFQGARAKNLNDVFIDIDLYVYPKRETINNKSKPTTISFNQLLEDTAHNIVLLGDPGAGKTTTIKKIFLEVLSKDKEIYETFNLPIVIKLKELSQSNDKLLLFNEILSHFGVFIKILNPEEKINYDKIIAHIFREFIERLNVLIILDGYDEISNDSIKQKVIHNLSIISNSLVNSRFILTSRSADYSVNIDNTEVYEISPLTENQISEFIFKWLKSDTLRNDLLNKLRNTPYWDTVLRPLLLAQMCALYEKNGDIPDKPKSVYDKIISLLLEEWSIQNSVKRSSKYGNFGVERKKEFLSTFAYYLTVFYEQFWFNKEILKDIYNRICLDFGLPKNLGSKVIKEIESHNGLIVQSGLDRFEFSHKSLAEYLVASYIIKMPQLISDSKILKKIPNEIAISISISSGPSFTLFYFAFYILKKSLLEFSFLKMFLARLLVENPDFERINPLFALSNIYMLNIISKELFIPYEGAKTALKENVKYYNECIHMLNKLCQHEAYKNSAKQIKTYYKIENQGVIPKVELDTQNWNEIFKLTRIGSLEYMGNVISMPDELYCPGNFLEVERKKQRAKRKNRQNSKSQ